MSIDNWTHTIMSLTRNNGSCNSAIDNQRYVYKSNISGTHEYEYKIPDDAINCFTNIEDTSYTLKFVCSYDTTHTSPPNPTYPPDTFYLCNLDITY